MNINIAILGPVSAGKSTLLNTLFIDKYSDMKKKRTTMTPQVYQETNKVQNDINILLNNIKINDEIIKLTENNGKLEKCEEVVWNVSKIIDFQELEKDVYLHIYDIPGLNDARTKDVYYKYLKENFYKFDIVVLVLDIESGLNTSDEIEILEKITDYIKNSICNSKNMYMVTLANKCDNLKCNEELIIEDEETNAQFLQIKNTVKEICSKKNIGRFCDVVIPICIEDAYIYRLCKYEKTTKLDKKYIDKLGINEYGKKKWNKMSDQSISSLLKAINSEESFNSNMDNCGFTCFQYALNNILSIDNQFNMIVNKLINKINITNDEFFSLIKCEDVGAKLFLLSLKFEEYLKISKTYNDLTKQFKKKGEFDFLKQHCKTIISKYLVEICNCSSEANEDTYYKNFLTLSNEITELANISNYNIFLIEETKKNISEKILVKLNDNCNNVLHLTQNIILSSLEIMLGIKVPSSEIKLFIGKYILRIYNLEAKKIFEVIYSKIIDLEWIILLMQKYLFDYIKITEDTLYILQLTEFIQRKMVASSFIYEKYYKTLYLLTLNKTIKMIGTDQIINGVNKLEVVEYYDSLVNPKNIPGKKHLILDKK